MATSSVSTWTARCEKKSVVSWVLLLISCLVFGLGGVVIEGVLSNFLWFLAVGAVIVVHLVRPMKLTWLIVLIAVAVCFILSLSACFGSNAVSAGSVWTAAALVGLLLLGTWNLQPKPAG